MTWTALGALFLGVLVGTIGGFALPSFIQLWRISQFAYAQGFAAGRYVMGAHVRRARRFADCKHAPNVICLSCAKRIRATLDDAERAAAESENALRNGP